MTFSTYVWWVAFGCTFSLGIAMLAPLLRIDSLPWFRFKRMLLRFEQVKSELTQLQQLLRSGAIAPFQEALERLSDLPAPWGDLLHSLMKDLQAQGQPMLPSIERLVDLIERQLRSLSHAVEGVGAPLAQGVLFVLVSPVVTLLIARVLPLDPNHHSLVGLAGTLAFGWSLFWLTRIFTAVEAALNGGYSGGARRAQVLLAGGEAWVALVRSGDPADRAWIKAHSLLSQVDLTVAELWGSSLWSTPSTDDRLFDLTPLRRVTTLALMEGRPCLERASEALASVERGFEQQVKLRVSKLAVTTLLPLFIGVIPSILGQFVIGFWLAFSGDF